MSIKKWISDENINSLVELIPEGRDKQKKCLTNIVNSVNEVENPEDAQKALKTAVLDLVKTGRILLRNKPHKKFLGKRFDRSDKKFIENDLLKHPSTYEDRVSLASSENKDVFGDNWYKASEVFFNLIKEGAENISLAIVEKDKDKTDIYKKYS